MRESRRPVESEPEHYFRSHRFELLLVCASFLIALTVVIGWWTDAGILTRYFERLPAMRIRAVVVAMVLSLAHLAALIGYRGPAGVWIARVLALLGGGAASAQCFEYIFGDSDGYGAIWPRSLEVGRMAPISAFAFALLGVSLILSTARGARAGRVSAGLALSVLFVSVLTYISYGFGGGRVFGLPASVSVSFPSATILLLSSLAVLRRVPDSGMMREIRAKDPAGALLRRLLAVALLGPIVLAVVVKLGQNVGDYDDGFAFALYITIVVAGIAVASFWAVGQVRRAEAARIRLLREEARLEEAERGLVRRDEFLSIASHELKTPLTPLKLEIQLAMRFVEDERVRRMLEGADRQITRLSRLVQDMLDVSALTMGRRIVLNPRESDLVGVLRGVLAEYEPHLLASQVEVKVSAPDELIGVFDPDKVGQLFLILLSNAAKFGRGRPVSIRMRRAGDCALVSVRDSGRGLRSDEVERIFRRFDRLDTDFDLAGLGIGLSVASGIVEAHLGRIRVRSVPGEGTAFQFRLFLRMLRTELEMDEK